MANVILTNTLSRKKEKFAGGKPTTIYSCGPTVYRNVHIGNLRTYVSVDILLRTLKYNGIQTFHVKNITDVGHMRTTGADEAYDPIVNEAIKEGKTPAEIAAIYTKAYEEDQKKLNIERADENPKATDNIKEMIELIKKLIDNGLAYEAEGNVLDAEGGAKRERDDGSRTIYFNVKKFKNYGQLSGNTLDKMGDLLKAVRVSAETDKKDTADFALWKKAKDDRAMMWNSPWGKGFPGWHIECSAMALRYLTDAFKGGKFSAEASRTIDIHTGGEDLVFPHHEDEIAQSEGATGKKFVKLWFHGGFLTVDGQKMARSANNFYTLEDIISKGYQPLSFRYLCLTAHYKSRLNFTWRSLEAAQTALNNLYREVSGYASESAAKIGCAEYESRFQEAVNSDLDTPKALAIVWELVGSNYPPSAKLKSLFKFDEVLGLDLEKVATEAAVAPEKVNKLVKERELARKENNFARADQLRKEIAQKGFEVVDTDSGPKLKKIIG